MTEQSSADTSATSYTAILFDFGGVITTSLLEAFQAFGARHGNAELPLKLLGTKGSRASNLLSAHEEGRISAQEFEAGYAEELTAHGMTISAEGLLDDMQADLHPDPGSVRLVEDLRAAGIPVGLLSNSFGDTAYDGFDLDAMFDAVTISGLIGARKPSRKAYTIACERLGYPPEETVMVDDLRHNLVAAAKLGMGTVLHRDPAVTRTELATLVPGVPTLPRS